MRFRILSLAIAVAIGNAGADEPKIHEFRLTNGLKVLVQEDHRAPVVVSQVWYKVGSSYEPDGITGISHMLEHMMFKGTKQHGPGEFSRIIAENGGSENAFTGQDYTAYFQTLERNRLEISLELEADRMRHLLLDEKEFDKEHQVVLEERRLRTDDQPQGKLNEHFNALAFSNSPYKNPVIGWPADVTGLTLKDLQDWYSAWYAPNNATVVVTGDVNPQEVQRLVEKYFARLKPSELPQLKPRTEVDQLGPRRIVVRVPAKLPQVVLGYKVPALLGAVEPWEAYALEVLAGILDGGNSARLSARLVRGKQSVVAAGAGYDLYARLPSLFTLEATPAERKSLQATEKALVDEIRDLQDQLVTAEELQRVKAQVLASNIYQRDSMFYQAMELGIAETVGLGWPRARDYVARVNAVTAQQIQQVARKYLIDDRLNVAYLEPLPMDPNKPEAVSPVGGHHVR